MNNLYFAIVDQIEFFSSGNILKFDEILRKSLHYCNVEYDQIGFLRYIYFDFLISLGVIELYYENDALRWKYLEKVTQLHFRNVVGEIKKNVCDQNLKALAKSNFDIFPRIEVRSNDKNKLPFLDKVLSLNFDWNGLTSKVEKEAGYVDHKKYIVEKFLLKKAIWVQVDAFENEYSLYRLRGAFNKTIYIMGVPEKLDKIMNSEWVFLIYCRKSQNSLKDIFKFDKNELTFCVPWKFKLPAIIKRIFFYMGEEITYSRDGICYKAVSEVECEKFFKLLERAG